jgi:hypothetical protein
MQVSFLCSLFASILLSNATPWRLQAHGTNESIEDAFHLDVPTSSGTQSGSEMKPLEISSNLNLFQVP